MKRIYNYLFCLLIVGAATSCLDKYSEELLMNSPVYLDYTTLRSSVKQSNPRDLVHPGKICFKDQSLFVVEYSEGIHLIDLSDPANPQNKAFIEVPGCIDIAINDHFLYADSYVDLVVIDLSDINHPVEKTRLQDVFPYTVPVADNQTIPYTAVDQSKGVVISWEAKKEKHSIDASSYPPYPIYYNTASTWTLDEGAYSGLATSNAGTSGASGASFGKSGSMARFGLYDKYLYAVNNYTLYMFNVENAGAPVKDGSLSVGSVETLFVYDAHLFFGTPNGMMVYDIAIPNTPVYVQSYWHITSCDPVVVQDGYAYITLRTGTNCQNNAVNRLDIIQCSGDYSQFDLVNSVPMTQPYGLGIDGNRLFVCDAGLKVYDTSDKTQLRMLASFPNIQTYDVIPADGYLFMVGDDGFYLYDYSDISNIHVIGHIPVVKQ